MIEGSSQSLLNEVFFSLLPEGDGTCSLRLIGKAGTLELEGATGTATSSVVRPLIAAKWSGQNIASPLQEDLGKGGRL